MHTTTVYTAGNSLATPAFLDDIKSHLGITGTQDDARLTSLIDLATEYIERETGVVLRTTSFIEVRPEFPSISNLPLATWYPLGTYPFLFYPTTRTWQDKLAIQLARYPVSRVDEVRYWTIGGSPPANQDVIWSPSFYYVMTPPKSPALIYPYTMDSYPQLPIIRPDNVRIRYTCGWGAPDAEQPDLPDCPAAGVHAIRLLVGAWNENREAETTVTTRQLELGVDRLLDQLKTPLYW
jgi:hypothetical protein